MQNFGFYEKPPFDLPADEVAASGRYENGELLSPSDSMDRVQVASMAFGQEQLLVTPLQMALVAESIANDGKMMKPYSVDSVSDYNGTDHQTGQPGGLEDAARAGDRRTT